MKSCFRVRRAKNCLLFIFQLNTLMKKLLTQKTFAILAATTLSMGSAYAQKMPSPAFVGYWETWGTMKLTQINPAYNVIDIAFAVTKGSSMYDMEMASFSNYTKSAFMADIDVLHSQKKVVILSIGGANDPVYINSASEKATFVSSMTKILTDYGDKFDGIDIDLEGTSIKQFASTWTMTSPVTQQQYLIDGIKQIMADYKTRTGKKLLLTMAPETYYVQGGLSSGQISGAGGAAYLPIIEALKNDIDMLHCQLYNGSSNIAVDGKEYKEGTGDFLVAMTETVIKGFTVLNGKGTFSGLPASKVGIGLPACSGVASGYVTPDIVCQAVKYIRGAIPKPSGWKYTLTKSYPDMTCLMTWDVNEDVKCSSSFAGIASCAFQGANGIEENKETASLSVYPNPAVDQLTVETAASSAINLRIINVLGNVVMEKQLTQAKTDIDISALTPGIYLISSGHSVQKFIKQ
jgi:chitinase